MKYLLPAVISGTATAIAFGCADYLWSISDDFHPVAWVAAIAFVWIMTFANSYHGTSQGRK